MQYFMYRTSRISCWTDQMAQVTLKIRNGFKIYGDAIASIKTAGLIGDRYIAIDPGGGDDLLENQYIVAQLAPRRTGARGPARATVQQVLGSVETPGVDVEAAERHVRNLANPAPVLTLSVRRPQSLRVWFEWLDRMLAARQRGESLSPGIQPDGAALHLSA